MAALLCDSIHKLCGGSCQILCRRINEVVCSPLFPYLAVTAVFNIGPVAWAVESARRYSNNGWCKSLSQWLLVNGVFCLIHILAALYIARTIQQQKHEELAETFVPQNSAVNVESGDIKIEDSRDSTSTPVPLAPGYSKQEASDTGASRSSNNASGNPVTSSLPFLIVRNLLGGSRQQSSSSIPVATATPVSTTSPPGTQKRMMPTFLTNSAPASAQRLFHVLCYDPCVAVYLLISLAWVVWLFIGGHRGYVSGDLEDADLSCSMSQGWVWSSLTCGYTFMLLSICAMGCSYLCLGQ